MELIRGLIACAFGLLFLTAGSSAAHLFMYSLGVYLVFDGALELYAMHRRKDVFHRKALDSVGGAMSLFAGLLSLIFPTVTLRLLASIIAVGLIFRSVSQMRIARRACDFHALLSWCYSGLFVLLALFVLLLPQLAISLLVVFLGSYMLVSGLILLLRGLSLRFRFGSFAVPHSQLLLETPGLNDDLPPSTRRAIVFVRRTAANGLGHIAWGFEWWNGWFNVGSVENARSHPFADPKEMDFWSMHTLDPIATIQHLEHPYDEYKLFFVTQPRPKEAWKAVIWESQQPYSFVHHNCCDVTYEILRTYGCRELLDPAKEYIPNDWYNALPGSSYDIATYPFIPISLHKQSHRAIVTREIALAIPTHIQGTPPSWLTTRWRPWEELTQVWEMMIGHIITLWTAGIKLIAQRRRSHMPHT